MTTVNFTQESPKKDALYLLIVNPEKYDLTILVFYLRSSKNLLVLYGDLIIIVSDIYNSEARKVKKDSEEIR